MLTYETVASGDGYSITQFTDEPLSHYSYAILGEQMAIIDPSRDAQTYIQFAASHDIPITAIIETHPHADFVSGHLEIAKLSGAKIYASKLMSPEFPFVPFDEGDVLSLGSVTLHALNTPGHSPDSITVLLKNRFVQTVAVFTGDTLFIGDVGRPDLRESVGAITAERKQLARQMFHSTRTKLMNLPNSALVFPAHGAGSLCGKNLSKDHYSTIERELKTNYALQPMSEDRFVELLTADQPFVPKYFSYNVNLNKQGVSGLARAARDVRVVNDKSLLEPGIPIVDARTREQFEAGHLTGAIHIPSNSRFETWLGSIIAPTESFYVVIENIFEKKSIFARISKIGYEVNLKAFISGLDADIKSPGFSISKIADDASAFTIVDVRNPSEVRLGKAFENSISIPLYELRERVHEIPQGKPIVVHCAGGSRSTTAASIISGLRSEPVYDMKESVCQFLP